MVRHRLLTDSEATLLDEISRSKAKSWHVCRLRLSNPGAGGALRTCGPVLGRLLVLLLELTPAYSRDDLSSGLDWNLDVLRRVSDCVCVTEIEGRGLAVVTVGCARTPEDSGQQTVISAIESRLAPQY